MPEQKSNELATRDDANSKAVAQLIGILENEATAEDDEFGSPVLSSVGRIFQADTEEEMWDSDDLDQTGGRDLVDVEMEIMAYAVKYSSNPTINSPFRDHDGRGMYLLVRSMRMDNGEIFVWNTSAPLVVSKVIWLAVRDKLPYRCVIRGRDQGAGQTLLKLKPIPQRITDEPQF